MFYILDYTSFFSLRSYCNANEHELFLQVHVCRMQSMKFVFLKNNRTIERSRRKMKNKTPLNATATEKGLVFIAEK